MVMLGGLDFAKGKLPQSWVALPRFHHQYIPDEIQYELGAFSEPELTQLKKLGHQVKPARYPYGNMQVVQLDKTSKVLSAGADPRGEGLAKVR